MKIIAIIGEPASGKTTIIENFIRRSGSARYFKFNKLVGIDIPSSRVIVFGKYFEGTFGGTDRLSMAVQPDAEKFLNLARKKYDDYTVIFEGDRLGNAKFFNYILREGFNFELKVLCCSPEQNRLRHIKRNDDQTQSFIKSRRTKIKNLMENFKHEVWYNEKDTDVDKYTNYLLNTNYKNKRF